MSIPQTGGGPIEHSDQLAEYLAAGCKPRDDWRIGTEHEKFGYCKQSLKPIPYDGTASIFAVLDGLRQRHGWAPVEEAGTLIGLTKDGANVSLEPGGQLELSGAPLATIHETCDEVNAHLKDVRDIADTFRRRFYWAWCGPNLVLRRYADDAKGALYVDARLYGPRWHYGQINDVPNLYSAG